MPVETSEIASLASFAANRGRTCCLGLAAAARAWDARVMHCLTLSGQRHAALHCAFMQIERSRAIDPPMLLLLKSCSTSAAKSLSHSTDHQCLHAHEGCASLMSKIRNFARRLHFIR